MKPTQLERVLAAARSFRGTCQAEWLADHTPDGGPRITRVAARIEEAEQRGYTFELIGWRSKTKVYRLLSQPDDVGRDTAPPSSSGPQTETPPSSRVSPDADDTLFDTPTAVPHWKAA
jgi:hypothetical protein